MQDITRVHQIREAVARIQALSGPTLGLSKARSDAAQRLVRLTKGINPDDVDDETLSELISLLDTWDDSVRASVAASLGNLGPRARVAAPKLIATLPEVECLSVELSSEAAIRLALKRIDSVPPPPPTCEPTPNPAVLKEQIQEAAEKVRASEPSMGRAKAAMRLAYLTAWLSPKQIDDGTLYTLISLLDIPDEPVREGIAESLGNLGPRAEIAAPKLRELLPDVDCGHASPEMAQIIRSALQQIGAKPPSPHCGHSDR